VAYTDAITTTAANAAYVPKTLTTTTGDIIYASAANTPARLGIGSTSQVLTVSGGVPTWATPTATSGPAFAAYRATNQTITANTWTKIQFATELFDTDSCYDNATNYRFTPTKAGIYQVNLTVTTNGTGYGAVYKNGDNYVKLCLQTGGQYASGSLLVSMNGSSDYLEFYSKSDNTTFYGGAGENLASATWIRSN
jgi:hypothetical protein